LVGLIFPTREIIVSLPQVEILRNKFIELATQYHKNVKNFDPFHFIRFQSQKRL